MNVKFFKALAIVAIASLALVSCKDDDDPVIEPDTLSVSLKSALNFDASGNEDVVITVSTNAEAWKAETTQSSWIGLTQKDVQLTVKISDNTATEARTGSIKITAGEAEPVTISVKQDAAVVEPEPFVPSYKATDVELTAMLQGTLTKVVAEAGTNYLWSPAEEINVFYAGEDGKVETAAFTSSNTDAAAVAKFTGSMNLLTNEDNSTVFPTVTAAYPKVEASAFNGTAITVNIPGEQTAVADAISSVAYTPFVAQSTGNALAFVSVAGGLKFTVVNKGVTKVTLKGNGDEVIAGNASVTFESGMPKVAPASDGVKEIVVNAPEGGFVNGTWYYVSAFPVELAKGFTATLAKGDKNLTVAVDAAVAVEAGTYMSMSLEAKESVADNIKNDWTFWESIPEATELTGGSDVYSHKRGTSVTKFAYDDLFLYGYYEYDFTTADDSSQGWRKYAETGMANNLYVWLDADGIESDQGGSWIFTYHKGYERMMYAVCSNNWAPLTWSPRYFNVETGASVWSSTYLIGDVKEYAVGAGEVDMETKIFKYTFTIEREYFGLGNPEHDVNVGIYFSSDASQVSEKTLCPSRAGFKVISVSDSE